MNRNPTKAATLSTIGPGIIVAATGLGAGDIVASAVAGASFGMALLWTVVVGGALKFALNEGIARWQLVTGRTMLEGWADHLHPALSWYFLLYLVLWSFIVAGALMAATGLAAHALVPQLSVAVWGAVHALVALGIVWLGGYRFLERAMKFFVGLMFVSVLVCAVTLLPSLAELPARAWAPGLPEGSLPLVLGVMGGVGGSVTLLSYGYWMREAGWKSADSLPLMRLDLGVAYGLTVLFGLCVVVIAAGVDAEAINGNGMALAVADRLGDALGAWGKWLFLVGFWGAVFSSMIGVWQGVPYLFADYVYRRFNPDLRVDAAEFELAHTRAYRGYLLYLALPPMALLVLDRPVWVVVLYAVAGAFFMPLLAAILLYMNSRLQWLGEQVNGPRSRVALWLCLGLFGFLLARELLQRLGML